MATDAEPRALDHGAECRSYLPTEPPCFCQWRRYIIVAATGARARHHAAGVLGCHPATHVGIPIIVTCGAAAEHLRGIENGPANYRLEVLEWPRSLEDGVAIRKALLLAGWPPQETA